MAIPLLFDMTYMTGHLPEATPVLLEYNPRRLLDALLERLQLPNDSALSRKLKVGRSIIDDIRHGRRPIGGSMLMWMSEATGISVPELRLLLGDRRTKSRLSVRIGA